MVRPQIVLFGDSIVENSFVPGGWGASLLHTFSRKADVIVRGYEGYNTKWALFLLNQLFPLNGLGATCAALIFFGANDAALWGSPSHVPLDQYKDNLKKIVTHLKELSPSMVVVLVTPLPVDDEFEQEARSFNAEKRENLPDRTNETTGAYAKQCLEVAGEMHVPWINLWFAMQQTNGWQKLFFDRSQLTEEGNAFVHREVVQVLNAAGIDAENMQLDFPRHFEIDEVHPECAFQQDICSSHLVDLGYEEEDFVAEMVIPSCTEESKLMSPPLCMGPAFEFDAFLAPLPDDAFFSSLSCANSSCGASTSSYMADLSSGFTDVELKMCPVNTTIQIKEEPLSLVTSSSYISLPKHINEEQPGPTTPLKEDASVGAGLTLPKLGTINKKKRSSRKAARQPPLWPSGKTAATKMCMHCQTKKTPQWRTGPAGAKTLCNACGVRYKRGLLFPEYRPVHSPTFVPQLHSNSYKEVAKMRSLKDGQIDWVES